MESIAFNQGREYEKRRNLDCATCDILIEFKPIIEYTMEKKFYSKKLAVSSKVIKEIKSDFGYNISDILNYILNEIEHKTEDMYRVTYTKSFKEYRFIMILNPKYDMEG